MFLFYLEAISFSDRFALATSRGGAVDFYSLIQTLKCETVYQRHGLVVKSVRLGSR